MSRRGWASFWTHCNLCNVLLPHVLYNIPDSLIMLLLSALASADREQVPS